MAGALSILLVDDSPSDVKLIVRELSRHNMTVDWERVDTREDMLAALKRRSIDAVISDWSMPKFSAPGALSVLQSSSSICRSSSCPVRSAKKPRPRRCAPERTTTSSRIA